MASRCSIWDIPAPYIACIARSDMQPQRHGRLNEEVEARKAKALPSLDGQGFHRLRG